MNKIINGRTQEGKEMKQRETGEKGNKEKGIVRAEVSIGYAP